MRTIVGVLIVWATFTVITLTAGLVIGTATGHYEPIIGAGIVALVAGVGWLIGKAIPNDWLP